MKVVGSGITPSSSVSNGKVALLRVPPRVLGMLYPTLMTNRGNRYSVRLNEELFVEKTISQVDLKDHKWWNMMLRGVLPLYPST